MGKLLLASLMVAALAINPAYAEETETETETEMELCHEEVGEGIMYIVNETGSTEEGEPITVKVAKDLVLTQIGLCTDIEGEPLSYVYIDDELSFTEHLGLSDWTLTLEKDALKEGKHVVELIQYDDDTEDGEIILCLRAEYEAVAE